MTRHYSDLVSASDWLNQISQAARPIRSTTQTWVVTRHQYGISALVSSSETSFGGETSDSVAKCQPAQQAFPFGLGAEKNRGRGFSFLIAREIKREPTPFPALLLAPFFARSLTFVPRSLLLKRTETLATQATKCFLRLRSMFGGSVSAKPPQFHLSILSETCLYSHSSLMMPVWGLLQGKVAPKNTYNAISQLHESAKRTPTVDLRGIPRI